MLLPKTEKRANGEAFDEMSPAKAIDAFVNAQQAAAGAVSAIPKEIDAGADAMAQAVRDGNSLIYVAAGSSGLMALADACELCGTFGISGDIVQIHMAGGVPTTGYMPGNTEDETDKAESIGRTTSKGDVALILSASGTTPYAVAAARSIKASGGTVIGIANNPSTELLNLADIKICLETPPEIIAGSTRLGGATAQKVALNLMSSLMGVKLGHVYQGLMVNLVADNAKLVQRAAAIVSQIAQVSGQDARDALEQTSGNTKAAILVAAGASLDAAQAALRSNDGRLGPCIATLKPTKPKKSN